MQKKKGISLIVLVITIIVMVILAGAIVLTLNNSGIIDKASDAVEQTNIATIKKVVQMAWAEAYANGDRTEEELQTAVDNALSQNKITEDMYKDYKIKVTTSGVELIKINHSGIIPEGGRYVTNATIVTHAEYGCEVYDLSNAITYTEGDKFPELKNGDQYIYGGYRYVYNGETGDRVPPNNNQYAVYTDYNGWNVEYISSNPNAGVILERINGGSVTTMLSSFDYQGVIETLTNIPSTIKNMERAFAGNKLKSVPDIPEGVVNMVATFEYAELETAPKIPSSVKDMSYTFSYCKVTGKITIDANPTNYEWCFMTADMSKITLAGKCSRELKQLLANTGESADQVTIID